MEFVLSQSEQLANVVTKLSVPGFSVAAVKKDQILLTKGFGLADIKQETPSTPETIYMWFSMTKIATATAIMQLVDKGKLDLDDKVSEYIPNFPTSKDSQSPRIRHLLNHSSGLANPIPIRWVHPASEPGLDSNEFFNKLITKHGKLKFTPGEKASYSNLGYLALGNIITASSGMTYKDYVTTNILKLTGMQQTDFYYNENMLESAAVGYQKRWSAMSLLLPLMRVPKGVVGKRVGDYIAFNRFYLDGSAYGGLIGNIRDAARLIQVHTNDGWVDGIQILSKESVKLTQQISATGNRLDVGFGWFREHDSSEQVSYLQQIGGGAGFFNVMRIYPKESLGIVVMGNSTSYNIEQVIDIVRSMV